MPSTLPDELRQKIDALVTSGDVVLFMKGTRDAPRCGFSAAVVEILNDVMGPAAKYETVDVLADPDLREGIKAYSDWPTIPQLYIKKEFVGGADIAKEMHASGELARKLGAPSAPGVASASAAPLPAVDVKVVITPAAAKVLKQARDGEPADNKFLRIAVSARFQHQLGFSSKNAGDAVCSSEGIDIVVDAASAARANGVRIDAVEQPGGGVAFRIDNPNEPPSVKPMSPTELKQRLAAEPKGVVLFDVRNDGERAIARIEGSILYDDAGRARLEELPKETTLVFYCHHGGRSQRAAEHALTMGFKSVFNVAGGIDAWSREVDPKVPRY